MRRRRAALPLALLTMLAPASATPPLQCSRVDGREALQLMSAHRLCSRSLAERDGYYRKAKVMGYRARSAFKLEQLDDEFGFLSDPRTSCVLDLCACPGSWSQVIERKLRGRRDTRIVAVDVQPMRPLAGVIQVIGDITLSDTMGRIRQLLAPSSHESRRGRPADVIVCDGAPDVTGLHDLDSHFAIELVLAALETCRSLLRTGGTFVSKCFLTQSEAIAFENSRLYSKLRELFQEVALRKPHSSRATSCEHFVVCRLFDMPTGGTKQARDMIGVKARGR